MCPKVFFENLSKYLSKCLFFYCYLYTIFSSPFKDLYTEVFSSQTTEHTLFWKDLWAGPVPKILNLTPVAICVYVVTRPQEGADVLAIQ